MVGSNETGNETYVTGLVGGMSRVSGDIHLTVYHHNHSWAESGGNIAFQRLRSHSAIGRLGVELPWRTVRDRLDVLHMTYGAPLFSKAPLVISVHDVSFRDHPHWFSPRDRLVLETSVGRAIKLASRIITLSSHSRAALLRNYSLDESLIRVIPLGPGPASRHMPNADAERLLSSLPLDRSKPFLFAVGNVQPRKNFKRLVEAFRLVKRRGTFPGQLVIAGLPKWRASDVAAAAGPDISFLGYVDIQTLSACYQMCQAFIVPSLEEGFGIPVVEAFCHKVPVACSSGGALPETAGSAARFFDPRDVEGMAAAIEEVLMDEPLRARLKEAGTKRAEQLSWKHAAEATAVVYREVARPG